MGQEHRLYCEPHCDNSLGLSVASLRSLIIRVRIEQGNVLVLSKEEIDSSIFQNDSV